MIRLSHICLIVFLATLALYFYQLYAHKDYSLAFLMMGAAGCLYLLMRTEQRYTEMSRKRSAPPERPDNSAVPQRVAPQCLATLPVAERKAMPGLSISQEQRARIRPRVYVK